LRLVRRGGWGRIGLVALVTAGTMLAGIPAQATGVQGHCDANGKPVIDYMPPELADKVVPVCEGGQFIVEAKQEFAEPKENVVIKRPDNFGGWVNISLNGKNVRNPYGDVRPYIAKSSNRTVVPLRYLSEAFGAKVDWNQEKSQASVEWRGRTIVVPIGKDTALVNGQELHLDQPALLWNDRTMVPLRFLLEAVGATVKWDAVNEFVHITLEGATCPSNYCAG
jgi:hypothetical protein